MSELYALKRVSFSDHLATSMKLPQTPANLQVKNVLLPFKMWFSHLLLYVMDEVNNIK